MGGNGEQGGQHYCELLGVWGMFSAGAYLLFGELQRVQVQPSVVKPDRYDIEAHKRSWLQSWCS